MSLAIVEASGRALDTHGWSPDRGRRPPDQHVPSEQIERWLTEGEHQTLEFKRDLDTDSVRKSFAEVVCAFANGAGGTILIGIDDDRTVVGYERPGSVADQIQNIVGDRVTERVTVGVDRIEVRGKAVYVVNVPATPFESKPHMVGTDTWLRAGATTHRATPAELRRLLTPLSRPSGPAFYG